MKNTNKLFHCFSLVLFTLSSSVYANNKSNDETIFSNAKKYTVKIKTRINYPFIEDSKMSSIGTGFIINKDKGLILTNAHVVGLSKSDVSVKFHGSKYYKAKKIYVDPVFDLAIIKIPIKHISNKAEEASLACNEKVNSGHPVGAYGHPWNLSFTSTRGIISGTPYLGYADWLQTDAPINSGNSGGPLIGLKTGKVIGISSAKLASRDAEGLNFALPIRYACKVINLIESNRDPSPPDLRVVFYETKDDQPLKIAAVLDNKSLLKSGDVIKGISEQDITFDNPSHLIHYLRGLEGTVNLNIIRNDKEIIVPMVFKKMKSMLDRKGLYFSGMIVSPNKYLDRKKAGVPSAWLVHFVDAGSSAEEESVQEWDLLVKIDNKPMGNFKDVYKYIIEKHKENKKVILMLKRASSSSHKMSDYHEVTITIKDEKVIEV